MTTRLATTRAIIGSLVFLLPTPNGLAGQLDRETLDDLLISSVRRGNVARVNELLRKGASASAANSSRMTALQYAANSGHVEIMKILISKGAQVNTRDATGRTPLLEAAGSPNAEAVKILLDAGARAHPEALAFACWLNRRRSVELLLAAGVSPDAGIVQAAQGGHAGLIQLLLDKDANVNARLQDGTTALHTGALQGGKPILELLLKNGAQPNAKNNRGETPLYAAISGDCELATVQLLVEAGARVDILNDEGVTPLRLAAIRGQEAVYRLLEATAKEEQLDVEKRKSVGGKDKKATEDLIRDLMDSKDLKVRAAIERELVMRGKHIMPNVLQAIEAGASVEQFYQLFTKMGPDADAALPKLESLLQDKRKVFGAAMTIQRMRPGALSALPTQARLTAADALYEAIVDPSLDMAPQFLRLLADMGDVSAPYILKLLQSEKPVLRSMAASSLSLSRFQDGRIKGEIVRIVRSDEHFFVRAAAARALGTSGKPSEEAKAALLAIIRDAPPNNPNEIQEIGAQELHDWRRLCDTAARSLATFGPNVIEDLIPFLSPIEAPERPAAMTALRLIGSSAVPHLIELLAHSDPVVATSAGVTLSRIGAPAVLPLAAALATTNEQVIERVASALWWIGPRAKSALPALLAVAGSEERLDASRLAAARAALKIDAAETRRSRAILSTIPVCIRVLKNGRFEHQGWAAETLGGIGPAASEALPMLKSRLELPGKDFDTGGLVRRYVRDEAKRAIAAITNGTATRTPPAD